MPLYCLPRSRSTFEIVLGWIFVHAVYESVRRQLLPFLPTVISTRLPPIEPPESASLRVTISRLFVHEQVLISVASGPWTANYHGFCRSAQRAVLVLARLDACSPNGPLLVAWFRKATPDRAAPCAGRCDDGRGTPEARRGSKRALTP